MFKQKTLLVILLVAIIALCAVAIHKGYSTKEGYASHMSTQNKRKKYVRLMKILDNNVTFFLNIKNYGKTYSFNINDVILSNDTRQNMMSLIGSEFTTLRSNKNPYKKFNLNQLKNLSNVYKTLDLTKIDENKFKTQNKFARLLFAWVLKHANFYDPSSY